MRRPFPPAPPARRVTLLQRKAGKLGKGLGKTTGWIHRAALQMKQVEMIGGVNYERIGPQGLFVTYGEKRQDGQLIECDTVVLCAGQEPLRELEAPLRAAGGRAEAFLPLLWQRRPLTMNLRNHRKVMVVDGALAFTGNMLGFALSPDGATVAVGGDTGGIWTAPTDTLAFTKVSTVGAKCLTWTNEGLYACGNDMASPMNGAYPGPGITLGPALVFACRAAQDLLRG